MATDSLNMPKGSVRAMLAFVFSGLFSFVVIWVMFHVKWDTMQAKEVLPILLPLVKELALIILVFYYVTKAKGGNE